MLFATATLARRIEDAESTLIAHFGRSARPRAGELPVVVTSIGGGTAVIARPGAPFNKIAGLGFAPIDEAALAEIEREFERRKMPVRVELASLGDPAIGSLLTRRGYALSGFENVLGLAVQEEEFAAADVTTEADSAHATVAASADQGIGAVSVRRCAPEEASQWLHVVGEGFAHPDTFDGPAPSEVFDRSEIDRALEDTRDVEEVVRYLATRSGQLAGGGAMRCWKGVAQLCGAATLPAHRRHGVQTALLRERLADAGRDGCDVAVVTTEPGSRSQENVQRQGFALLYTRAVLIKS
ncbi:MAG: GNAT family N-acetyltransferase [Acidobacteriota bacterium]